MLHARVSAEVVCAFRFESVEKSNNKTVNFIREFFFMILPFPRLRNLNFQDALTQRFDKIIDVF